MHTALCCVGVRRTIFCLALQFTWQQPPSYSVLQTAMNVSKIEWQGNNGVLQHLRCVQVLRLTSAISNNSNNHFNIARQRQHNSFDANNEQCLQRIWYEYASFHRANLLVTHCTANVCSVDRREKSLHQLRANGDLHAAKISPANAQNGPSECIPSSEIWP